MLLVTPAEEKHIPDILRLLVQVNMVHHLGRPDLFKGPTTKYDAEELKQLLSSSSHRIFVCLDDDRVVGHAFSEIQDTAGSRLMQPVRTMYIDDICVDENARRHHVGQAMFEHVKAEAAALGCDRITLSVWELNPGARCFYDGLGLKPLKTIMDLRL